MVKNLGHLGLEMKPIGDIHAISRWQNGLEMSQFGMQWLKLGPLGLEIAANWYSML